MRLRFGAILLWFLTSVTPHHAGAATPLRIGVEINNEPISFVQSDGRPSGFVVELIDAVAQEMKFPVTPVVGKWDDLFSQFKSGEIEAMASLAYSPERDRYIDFSISHLRLNGALFVRKGDQPIRDFADLRTRRIALPRGGFTQEYLSAQRLNQHFIFVPSLSAALHALETGECDAIAATEIIAGHILRQDNLTNVVISPITLPGFSYELRMGVHAGDSDHLALLNEGLARIRMNGTYDRLYEKWIGPLEPRRLTVKDLKPYLWPALLGLGAIGAAFVWQRRILRRTARQAEALRQSEERLTLVLEGSEDVFWDCDLRTGRVERSKRWATMLGYSMAEIPATFAGGLELVHAQDQPVYLAHRVQFAGKDAQRSDIEYRMKSKSGEWRWILDRGKIVTRAPDGSPLRMAGTQTDITDLKRVQQELAYQEAQFRFIYQHVPVGISWLRRQQADTRLVNPAHERITGVPAARSRDSANYIAATHPEDRGRQNVLLAQLYRGEIEKFAMEKRYVHADGMTVWALLTTHLYHDPIAGEAQEVTTLVDITGIKQAEADRETLRLKMLDAQKLESLGVLAGGIAHDFNNLLTVILANATMVRHESDDPAAQNERLGQIETAARRAADLCRQMLAYAGRGNFIVERVDLGQMMQDTAHLLRVSISKKARLGLNITPRLPQVDADPSQLQQVVMNLVINASDALGDEPGEINLSTRLGRPQTSAGVVLHSFDLPEKECVCLEVSDTGQGMTPATLARVFDPFFTTKFAGRGLGLAAVLGIVRAHRGALTVESTPGRGTRFCLFLPAATLASTPTTSAFPVVTITQPVSGKILIADDEPAVLGTTDKLLRRRGYQTVLAIDGLEAVQKFRAEPHGFAAVLLDLTMPGLDGAEALRAIRAINPKTPILLASGYSERDVLERLHDQGPVPVLRKPFTNEALLTSIAQVIAG